ncbi:MAG: 4-aminobutyrate transaminase [Candidatus Fraserbacteria bacterium RBG_16_55_9]|uniref:4-aminobutyrate transaminase n=1 Tax=Fraserbacteria sp. (strain RBG_16_55_9) TaxID=1817864 RepID=A0A1F5UYS5_FRAXR|nr:MAG: 4-aminobutyrate transaminase [Candidatus Fraserbacteria bacterium RBG_16_55_9]
MKSSLVQKGEARRQTLKELGPKSKALSRRKEAVVAEAVSPLAPFFIAESRGSTIQDVDGNEYLDFTGGWGCLNVGHNHPKVVQAIQQQAERFIHTDCSVVMYEPYIELAERLTQYAPGNQPKKAAFFNSGAEAVENSVKIARYHTKRRAIIVFEGAFHGRTLLAMTMTHKASPYKAHFGPFAPDVYRAPYPNPYRNPMSFVAWEKQLKSLVAPEEIAAVVIEPIQGEGGFVVPSEGFLACLRKFCDDYGIVLVADEVQSGIGRTGKFFASERFEMEPDLICIGKSLASGLPLSGVLGVAKVIDTVPDSGIGGTYVGNPVACAAGVAVLDVIEEEDLLERAEHLGSLLEERFQEMQEQYDLVGDVRGVGAMQAIELVKDRQTKEPASEETAQIIQGTLKQGVIFAKAGLYGNVIRMLIPLVMSDEELNDGLDVLEGVLAKVSG